MARFVAAAIQAAPVFMDKMATTHKACALIREASQKHGAKLVAFPESFIPAFPYGVWHHGVSRNMAFYRDLTEKAVRLTDPEVTLLQAACQSRSLGLTRALLRQGAELGCFQLCGPSSPSQTLAN